MATTAISAPPAAQTLTRDGICGARGATNVSKPPGNESSRGPKRETDGENSGANGGTAGGNCRASCSVSDSVASS